MNRDKIGTWTCYVHQHTFVGTLISGPASVPEVNQRPCKFICAMFSLRTLRFNL